MARTTVANFTPDGMEGIARSRRWRRAVPAAACVSALLIAVLGAIPASGAPAEGDTYVYVEVDAYTNEVKGRLRERVTGVDPDRVTISVEPDGAVAGFAHTKVLTKDGNWLQNLVVSHGKWLEYLFAAPYPAYVFPLTPGRTWSQRVDAKVSGYTRTRSVRVDGAVLGLERIRVPAGEYDTVKIRRFVYAGDAESPRSETAIIEYEWYAPALGRPVRATTESKHLDMSQTSNTQHRPGDRLRYELVEVRPAGR
jgi:hypothetical protein